MSCDAARRPAGATLLALHRNRLWDNGTEGIVLDAGPFVAALEYATGTRTALVLTGLTDREALGGRTIRPDVVLDAIGDLLR